MRLKRRRRPFKKTDIRRVTVLCTVVLLLVASVWFLDRRVIPPLLQYSRTQAERTVTRMLNESVTAVLADTETRYDNLVTVSRDDAGTVTSVEADVRTMNLLKAALSAEIADRTGGRECLIVSIPLGTLLNSRVFGGRGPMIRIPVGMSCGVLTDFESSLDAAGINQTAHRILLRLQADVFLAVPTAHTSADVTTTYIIAESILLGKIPDAYTVVENIDEETVGEIFDYGAQLEN